jgi:uncharacterized protein (TIGR02145 family)
MVRLFLTLSFVLLVACSQSFTDARDGNTYKIIQIGTQAWMAENLAYESENSYCPDGEGRNCSKMGRLYTWEAARTACPEGWRLPDSSDFAALIAEAGGTDFANAMAVAGEKLKSTGGWFKKGNGSDVLGFNALPAGYRGAGSEPDAPAKYDGIGGYAYFWSATATPDDLAYYLFLDFSSKAANLNAFLKEDARSVRCVSQVE